jgi:hypothetical protein
VELEPSGMPLPRRSQEKTETAVGK